MNAHFNYPMELSPGLNLHTVDPPPALNLHCIYTWCVHHQILNAHCIYTVGPPPILNAHCIYPVGPPPILNAHYHCIYPVGPPPALNAHCAYTVGPPPTLNAYVMSYSQMAVDSQEHAATTRLLASVNQISSTHVYKILHKHYIILNNSYNAYTKNRRQCPIQYTPPSLKS